MRSGLKAEVFEKKKVTNLYSQNTANVNAKFLMFKMIETCFLGYLMNVNIFNENTVENFQNEVRKALLYE